ncbi:hypothetical protein C7E18_11390, partial [Stenotrophomonas maltophilia]
MNDISASRDSWWLASLGNTLIWARLRVRPAGTAEVLDSDGNTLSYDSEDTARSQLFDAESWWLASLGNTLIWARLRVRPAGTAEVLDSDGNTL